MTENGPPWEQAVHAVLNGMSIRKAARTFPGVEREALRRRVHGLVDMHEKEGRRPVYLSRGHEQGVVEVVAARSHMGICIEEPEMRYIIRQCALAHNPKGVVPPAFPNNKWISRFVKSHKKELSFRKPHILDEKRAEHSTEEVVRGYASRLEPVLRGVSPECIWNCDETGVCAQGTAKTRVLCSRGLAANTRRSHDRENVSIMGCANAAGGRLPPMYIFAGEFRKPGWLDAAVKDAVCAMTESSNVNGNMFLHWLKFFVRCIGAARPQVLILDGHFAHLSHAAVEFAISKGVKLFLLPSHTSHFLQPLDVSVFREFKTFYNDAVSGFPALKGLGKAALPTRDDIPALTKVPFVKAFKSTTICRGFFNSGIFPFNVDIMLEKMVGSLSSRHKLGLPHHAALETSALDLQLTDRERKQLERKGLDVDAIKVVAFHAKNLTIPKVNSRTRGGYLTPLMTKGVLLTGPEMHEAFRIHSEMKAMQAADQESRRLRRFTNKLDAQALRDAKRGDASRELVERRSMRVEDLAAHSIRRAAQRANAVTIKARKKAETQQAKETQRANRKRCPAECRAKAAEPQRKRRPLQDITPGQISILKSSQ